MRDGAGGKPHPAEGALHRFVGDAVWTELLACAHERSHSPGDLLLRQGERGTHVLAVLRGVTKVVRRERNGEVTLLAFRGPGELLGEVAVLDDGTRSASVEAISQCAVAVVSGTEFLRFAAERELFPALVRYALARLRESDEARVGGAVPARLAATLVTLTDSSGRPATAPHHSSELALTRNDLAQHLGISRNTVTAALRELQYCGVRAGRMRIVVDDLDALRRAAADLST